uniref:Putative secreted protein n=1 Tax=Lutzomyia longipalpis TaxID=7200 RepID=A0A7G3AML5_LUTLO
MREVVDTVDISVVLPLLLMVVVLSGIDDDFFIDFFRRTKFSSIQSTAAAKLSRTAVGGGLHSVSGRYFPVFTRIPFMPSFMAP